MLGPQEVVWVIDWLLIVVGHSVSSSHAQRRNKKLDILTVKIKLARKESSVPNQQEVV